MPPEDPTNVDPLDIKNAPCWCDVSTDLLHGTIIGGLTSGFKEMGPGVLSKEKKSSTD